jgi:glycosyltransferase involved in cell wall biosynthesis
MSLSAPPLTVALLTYNRLHYLKEAIEAILNQSYKNFELLLLDNCSTDGTGEFVLGLRDPRIRYVRNSSNYSSVQFNCLSAFHIALGRRVIVTHDDDIMEGNMLEQQMHFLDCHPDVHLVWTRVSDIDQDGQPIAGGHNIGCADRIFGPGEYITSFLKERLWPMPSGVMLERSVLPKAYAVDAYLRANALVKNPMDAAGIHDVLLPARINRKSAVGYIDKPLLRRRVHTNQFSHAASLSRPGVYLYRKLKKIARGVPTLQSQSLHFDMFVARFDIQEAITTNARKAIKPSSAEKIRCLAEKLKDNIEHAPDAFLAGLPIFLLHNLIAPTEGFDKLNALQTGEHGSATRKLLSWAQQITNAPESSILESLAGKRILIFGSAFIAALLILEGRKKNDLIVACIDSNVNRHGRMLLGVPIQPLTWMRDHITAHDVIIISSERDHEHYIEAIIRQGVQEPAAIVSWKNLLG